MPISTYIRDLRQKIGHDLVMSAGASAVILNDQNEVLLQRRSDNGHWGLPGGAIDPGEEPADAVIREVREETGLEVAPERIIGVYGGPDLHIIYPNGDESMFVSIAFVCRVVGGELTVDHDESLELKYFAADNLPSSLIAYHRLRIEHALKNQPAAYFYHSGANRS